MQESCDHAPFSCTFTDMVFVLDQKYVLRDSFTYCCKMCNKKAVIESELPPQAAKCMDVNTAAVSGIISIGCGFSNLSKLISSLNVPSMSSET